MSDILKAVAMIAGLMLVGTLIGTFWHAHGGQWWVIPLLAVGVPIVVIVVVIGWAVLGADWSH